MKRFTLAVLFLALGFPVSATHLMGGEMTVEHMSGNQFIIHLTAYRDTIGVPFALDATFDVYDSNTNTLVLSSTVPQDPGSGNLIPGAPYGVEVYFFTDTVTVPGPGAYRVEWWNCCRNGAITNLTAPLNENMFLYTEFTHYALPAVNSTPVFLAPPVTFVPINLPWQYNSLPLDPDGDSLSWTLDTPYTTSGVYAAGWVTPSAANNGAFTLDPITGQIDWTPNMFGNFVASIRVEEFRAGVKIGEIRRDYQMIIIDDTTKKSPRITNFASVFPKDANGHYNKHLPSNTPVVISLLAEDPDGEQVQFFAYGEPFLLAQNPATFVTYPYNGTDMLGMFIWTTDATQARANPYIVVFRTRDPVYSFDETVLFYVDPPVTTGIDDAGAGDAAPLYPNPAVNLVYVPFHLDHPADASVVLTDLAGREVATYAMGTLPAGDHAEKLVLDVPPGTYLIRLVKDGRTAATRKLVVK